MYKNTAKLLRPVKLKGCSAKLLSEQSKEQEELEQLFLGKSLWKGRCGNVV